MRATPCWPQVVRKLVALHGGVQAVARLAKLPAFVVEDIQNGRRPRDGQGAALLSMLIRPPRIAPPDVDVGPPIPRRAGPRYRCVMVCRPLQPVQPFRSIR